MVAYMEPQSVQSYMSVKCTRRTLRMPNFTRATQLLKKYYIDRIPSTTPGAEPPRDASDSGSARSHSMHLETSSSDRP